MKIVFTAALVALMPTFAAAETLTFPSDSPIAAITIPDSWNPHETDSGIEAISDDQAIYFSIDVADAETSDQVIDDAVAFLSENGVTIDESTQKQSEDTINGMSMSNFDWNGSDADGPVSIGLSVLSPSPGHLMVVTYWGTKGEQEKHGDALVRMISSLKPAT